MSGRGQHISSAALWVEYCLPFFDLGESMLRQAHCQADQVARDLSGQHGFGG